MNQNPITFLSKRRHGISWCFQQFLMFGALIVIFSLGCTSRLSTTSIAAGDQIVGVEPAGPVPGDLFRDYSWLDKMYVIKFPGWKEHTEMEPFQEPIKLPQTVDLAGATKAELAVEIANTHLGWEDMYFRINGHERMKIRFPVRSPQEPSPSRWFNYWSPSIPVSLSDLKSQGNTIEFMVGPFTYDAKNPHQAWEPVYSVSLRIYYDAQTVPHPDGEIASPVPGSLIGSSSDLRVKTSFVPGHETRSVDFVGRYEDLNYEGDGVYYRWHYQLHQGKLRYHLGSADSPQDTVKWDTSWVPDQISPMSVAAWLKDSSGLTYVTSAVKGLRLDRPGLFVELARPYDVPMAFTSCQYGSYIGKGPQTEKFYIRGDLTKMLDARFAMVSFNGTAAHGFAVNGAPLEKTELPGAGFFHHLTVTPLIPAGCLKPGENSFTLLPGTGRSSDVALPGPAVLVRYKR